MESSGKYPYSSAVVGGVHRRVDISFCSCCDIDRLVMARHGAQHIYTETRSFEASSAWLKQLSIKPLVVDTREGAVAANRR